MDLKLATVEDIANELLRRQIRFAFAAIEDTNTRRVDYACFSGKGIDHQDVSDLFEFGREVFERGESGTDNEEFFFE